MIVGHDRVARAAKIRTGKSYLERAIQHLYPLELSCDLYESQKESNRALNPEAREFRPSRRAAANATEVVRLLLQEEDELM